MVSALGLMVLLAATPAALDSSAADALEAWRIEDAVDEGEGEDAFLARGAESTRGGDPRARPWARGRIRFAAGGRAFTVAAGAGTLRGEALLARESGESRPIDDAYGALAWTPSPRVRARVGWIEPRIGAGLVLGPRRVTTRVPAHAGAAPSPWLAAPLPGLPARAAAAFRGVALEHTRGAVRVAALAAWTPREARASGAAWRPVLGARHRNADEEARRGRLDERVLAFAAGWSAPGGGGHAWATALAARTGPRRGPYDGSSALAESAAVVARGGPASEVGAAWSAPGGAAGLEAAAAFDAGGRLRARFAATAERGATRAGLVLETEARGFVPLRAVPERRPRAQVEVALERRGPTTARLEAQAIDRGGSERPRLGLALAVAPPGRLRIEARHDGEPRRTRLAVRLAEASGGAGPGVLGRGARLSAGAEARFDPAGLARRTAWIAGVFALPLGVTGRIESRLGGGRSGAAWLDEDVSGGRLVRPGPGAARLRCELARPGRLVPRLSWARTTAPNGHSDEVRLGVDWIAGPASSTPE